MSDACEVWFYHLERTALEQALPELLEKTLARGWRALVRAREAERLEHLDAWLWTWREDSFLAHGLAAEVHAEHQPVLLTLGSENVNGANALFVIDRADLGLLDGYERCILLFDGRDEDAVRDARERWKTVKGAGHPVSYWREGADRGWEKQA